MHMPIIAQTIERAIIAAPCAPLPLAATIIPITTPAIPNPGGKNKSEIPAQAYPVLMVALFATLGACAGNGAASGRQGAEGGGGGGGGGGGALKS